MLTSPSTSACCVVTTRPTTPSDVCSLKPGASGYPTAYAMLRSPRRSSSRYTAKASNGISRPISSGILLEQLVEVDDRRDLAAEIEQRQQDVALAQA